MPESTHAFILIVDDDPTLGLLARETLTQGGFSVQVAQNAKQMRGLLRDFPADMILLDVRLPDASGIELCTELRASDEHAHTPILMITGTDDNEAIRQAYAAGATDFMPKPLNWQLLFQRVRYMWRTHQMLLRSRQSERLLAQAQHMAMMGSWEKHLGSGEFTVSEQFACLFGNAEPDCGKAFQFFLDTVSAGERAGLIRIMDQVGATGKPATLTHHVGKSNGFSRTVRHDLDIRRNPQGRPLSLCGTLQDITSETLRARMASDRNGILESMLQNAGLETLYRDLFVLLVNQAPGSELAVLTRTAATPWNCAYCSPGLESGAGRRSVDVLPGILEEGDALRGARSVLVGEVEGAFRAHLLPISLNSGGRSGTVICAFIPAGLPDQESAHLDDVLQTVSDMATVILDNHRLTSDLQYQAFHDSLTGLPNRFFFLDHLRRTIAESGKNGLKRAVIFIDLDRFKNANDLLGHSFGDKVLQEMARRLQTATRPGDILARTGGDEFMLISAPLGNYAEVERMCARFMEVIAPPFEEGNYSFNLSVSIGASLFPADSDDPGILYQYADVAMQHAKKNGGSVLRYYDSSIMEQFMERLELENDMGRALEQGEFLLEFQPQVDMETRKTIGYEALIRWRKPDGRLIPPSAFIPIAEETGFIVVLGSWVLETACREIKRLHLAGQPWIRVAVNVSAVQFVQDNFLELVQQTLEKTGFPADRLELEMTESTVMHGLGTVAARLDALRKLGITISIDDFGTGYSSMSYLKSLPIDSLKVDRSFIMEIGSGNSESRKSEALVDALITLADNLGLTVTAEGVENEKQLEFLRQKHCDRAQGYHTGRPAPLPGLD